MNAWTPWVAWNATIAELEIGSTWEGVCARCLACILARLK